VDNDQVATPTYAGDLAKVILKIISDNNNFYGIYHYSNEGEASWYDFAKSIFEANKIKIKLNPIRSKEYQTLTIQPKFNLMDKSKIRALLKINICEWDESLLKTPFFK